MSNLNNEELIKNAERLITQEETKGAEQAKADVLMSIAASLLVVARNMDKLCNTQTIPPFKSPHNNS